MAFKMKGFTYPGTSPNKIYDKPKGERTVYKQKEEKRTESLLDEFLHETYTSLEEIDQMKKTGGYDKEAFEKWKKEKTGDVPAEPKKDTEKDILEEGRL